MVAGQQIRLLLWKDYLVRKRNPITLGGILWATLMIMSLYIVRINVDNEDFPTCQFAARALPSAGVLSFLQSFLCTANNECSPMDQFEEIPSYFNSTLTQLKHQFSPLFSNESILDAASTAPNALKLLATLADVADVPDFVHMTKNGLQVKDLFRSPDRVMGYMSIQMKFNESLARVVMSSELSMEGVVKGDLDRCRPESIVKTLKIKDAEHLNVFVKKICSLSSKDLEKLVIDLLLEVDLGKYIKMLGEMYFKLSKDNKIVHLGEMVSSVLNMMNIQSFLPPEVTSIFMGETPEFSYIQLDLIPSILDHFKPVFGDTQIYRSTRELADSAVLIMQYLHKFLEKRRAVLSDDVTDLAESEHAQEPNIKSKVEGVYKALSYAVDILDEINTNQTTIDVFNVLARVSNFVYKFLPDRTKHDLLFYSTLTAKLVEGAERVTYINVHLEELIYNVSMRHPEAIRVLVSLPIDAVEKGLDAFADAERIQILTSKLDSPGEMFCDINKLKIFFDASAEQAGSLQTRLCIAPWKSYMADLISSFGIYDVRSNINTMASLFISETLGKDTKSQLYTLDRDFEVLKSFTQMLTRTDEEIPLDSDNVDLKKLFGITEASAFMKVVRDKKHLGKHMLVTVHGALAKEVVKQNPILEFKIAPFLIDTIDVITALNKDIDIIPQDLATRAKNMYPFILRTILNTALDEDKTYKLLSTYSQDALCRGIEIASLYLNFPPEANRVDLNALLCNLTEVFEMVLRRESHLGKTISRIMITKPSPMAGIKWTTLITDLKSLYVKIEQNYPYVLEYRTYGMEEKIRKDVVTMMKNVKEYWLSLKNWKRSIHLSIKLAFGVLELMDSEIFDINNETWLKMKYILDVATKASHVADDIIKVVRAVWKNETFTSSLPPITVTALTKIIPNFAYLLRDSADIVIQSDTEIEPIIKIMNGVPAWPCSNTSLSELLKMSDESHDALRSVEKLMCLDMDLQEEWVSYLQMKKVDKYEPSKWNTTVVEPHVFLRSSAAFDIIVEDMSIINEVMFDVLDEPTGDRETLLSAWNYAVSVFNNTNRDSIVRFLSKADAILNSVQTPNVKGGMPLHTLWRSFLSCNSGTYIEDSCKQVGRATWINILKFLSVTLSNLAGDLFTYFEETNEPDSNFLQLVGFTKNTGVYLLYEKLPELMGVLVNSYTDYGFMVQIRRAALSNFWDCEALVKSLRPAPGSPIDEEFIKRIYPFVCPSLLYWVSLPRGDNTLLDVVAKPQYYFFTSLVDDLNSTFEEAFVKATILTDFFTENNKKEHSQLAFTDMNTIKGKLQKTVDAMINFKMVETNPSYKSFSEASKKQFISNAYLTRVITIVNKIVMQIEDAQVTDFTANVPEDEMKVIESDLMAMRRLFKRRPSEAIAVFFDAITNDLWRSDKKGNIVNSIKASCDRLSHNETSLDILTVNNNIKAQICGKKYEIILSASVSNIEDDYSKAKDSLLNLVRILEDGEKDNMKDIAEFVKSRRDILNSLKTSIKYSYELGVPIYLKYLQSNLQHYDVVMSYLSGGDWWQKTRDLYNGPHSNSFFDGLEKTFEIIGDFLTNLDKVHWVRLIRDVNANNTQSFCKSNASLEDYLPDTTGALTTLKHQLCLENKTGLFKELPIMLFASQIYENDLKIPKEVDYATLDSDIMKIESQLEQIQDGPKTPQLPSWVTRDKLEHFRIVALGLLSKETITKVSFGLMTNMVDAGTLLLNNSHCGLCSQFTTWFKQLNLQLYKKQEYDNLLCQVSEMTLQDVYNTLKNDFHWDMTIKELLSTRNYTKYELNKSMNEFLEQVKLHFLEDITANQTKLSQCLAHNVTRNVFGNVTLFTKLLSQTTKLLRAELLHLHEVDGIRQVKYLIDLNGEIAPNLDVNVPLMKYLKDPRTFSKKLKKLIKKESLIDAVLSSHINLRTVRSLVPDDLKFEGAHTVDDLCEYCDCDKVAADIVDNFNLTLIERDLAKLQKEEFWRFNFVSNILHHAEDIVGHVSRMLGVVSRVDVDGVRNGRLVSMIDAGMQLLMDDTISSIVYSLRGIIDEFTPIEQLSALRPALYGVSQGLIALYEYKKMLIEEDIKVPVFELFSNPERLEEELSGLGINQTNFWSISAPRIHVGYIQLKPIFASQQGVYRISDFVCEIEGMSKVIVPGNVDVVTLEDVYGAVVDQFCDLDDDQVKRVVPVLLQNINYTFVVDKIKNWLLTKLYTTSELTRSEGDEVLESLPKIATLIPVMQNSITGITDLLEKEPLLQHFKKDVSLGNLISGGDFMADAGRMMCGKPFHVELSRFFKTIIEAEDLSGEVDSAQIDVLPTDFCRSMYKEIISIDGGKIVWSFIKPLIMGKILYTPPSPAVDKIIEKANLTFASTIKLVGLVHSFARAFPSVSTISDHRQGLVALMGLLTAPDFEKFRRNLLGDTEVPSQDLDVEKLLDRFGNVQDLGGLLQKGSDILQCVNFDRFKPIEDEQQLSQEAVKLMRVNEFSAGLVFLNGNTTGEIPYNVEYKIRMDIENTPTTNKLKNFFWIPGPDSNFVENMRYFRGFIQIQDMIDQAIVKLSQTNSRAKRETVEDQDWAVYTQQEPYPCYQRDIFQTSLYESQSTVVTFFFAFLFTVASVVRFVVADKESGNTMLMSVMGVNLNCHTASWWLASLVEVLVTTTCVGVVLCAGGVLPRSAPSLIFVVLYIYAFSLLSFCYMMSKLFKGASFAAVCSGIIYLITYMPFVIIIALEAVLVSPLKYVVSLFMSSTLIYAFLFITRYEAIGVGAHWAQLWEAPDEVDDMSIGMAAILLIADGVIYIVIGLLIERFYGLKTQQTNMTNCSASGEKAGVSIVNVGKVYGEGSRRAKVALHDVSMELRKGQITSLLGHNGAGKTTLINILTGMLKPTTGHVVIRTEDNAGTLGVCPQRDVLFEQLTAWEHIALYAQLKRGRGLNEVRDEVDSMVSVVSLGEASGQPVCRLSGGTRRRLCVALAFIAHPGLVVLDEPTAGVDPAARRDIWSMILKLRENRTILLTTHHLDEAELLSDQIVIMHKGQVHTTGSPIEIKRALGSGYKLIVMYPERRKSLETFSEILKDEDLCTEMKTKQLLGNVRSVIRNANLVDVNGLEVEINLPFFDADGTSNNYLELCSLLESQQETLGFDNFSMDCSSLEHVFFNICQQADATQQAIELVSDVPSKSGSTATVRNDRVSLVSEDGPLVGSVWQQFLALLHIRLLHYTRNRWLLFTLILLPSLFVLIAMAFSTIRPPPNNEFALRLHRHLYANTTEFLVENTATHGGNVSPSFAQRVMDTLTLDKDARNWTYEDNPTCKCVETKQECDLSETNKTHLPDMMLFMDVNRLNDWLIASHEVYIEKRYGGFSSSIANNVTNLVVWYNNKGHHAMPAYLNALNNALLRAASGRPRANITTYSHPLKISTEQINKNNVYLHIADAGITAILLIAYSLVSGGSAIYLVTSRRNQEKRLQLLAGVSPILYWVSALTWDIIVILLNILITAVMLSAFHFPIFIAGNNLPAICILILLYGYACAGVVHVAEKLFSQPSLANMIMFCGNAFVGAVGVAILLILDLISASDATDNARWVLHKILLLSPQFVLGDGLLEIAKNTIKAQVLGQFGIDTYRDPLVDDLVMIHYISLIVVGTAFFVFNLAIEYDCFEVILVKCRSEKVEPIKDGEMDTEVLQEKRRVQASKIPLRIRTIGNINAGFIDSEDMKSSIKSVVSIESDVAQCERVGKAYPMVGGYRMAVRDLTLGIPPGQCTALLGQNGAGKSTTFAMLTGEVRPSAGTIYLNGKEVSSRQLCQGLISYCPQSDAIDPLLTVRETLQFFCRLRGIADQKEVIRRTIDMFELTKYADVRNGTLSGGNKRKLCTAIAFMGRSPLVLLDEPTSGMDPLSRACVSRGVRAACAAGRGVLLSTHALDDARRLAARVALLQNGQLKALAPLNHCLQRFGGGYVVAWRVRRGAARRVWWRVRRACPHAQLRVLHHAAVHVLLPTHATVNGKEITTKLSDVFRLTTELQGSDVEDFTVNQSSLDQMFLSFAGSGPAMHSELETSEMSASSSPTLDIDDLCAVTAL